MKDSRSTNNDCTEWMGVKAARGSQYNTYWIAVESGCVSAALHRVILFHNSRKQGRCPDPFYFDKVVFKLLRTRQVHGRDWANRTPLQQDAALSAALGKAIKDATDEELSLIRYSRFKRALEALTGE